MFTLTRAAAVVALVALGAGLVSTSRLGSDEGRGGGPGAESASPSPSPAVVPGGVFVHGTMHLDGGENGPDYLLTEVDGNRQHEHGDYWYLTSTFDDPRISGDTTWLFNLDAYPQPEPLGWTVPVEIKWGEIRIENADGAWVGTWSGQIEGATDTGHLLFKMTGEGAYEGLAAMLEGGNFAPYPDMPTAGVIFEGSLPPG